MGLNLLKYNKQEDSVSIYNYGADERKFISKIGEDENNNLWVLERLNGKYVFYRLNPYNDDYKIIDRYNGLDDYNYSSFYMDRNGIYWIGGYRNRFI
ncbi:MAG: two-component regulator propeller domain-containing protein [Melioribacteraceae bacterium]|nr:two-component regulator propeller domain-containing protein [Melioribacteraceae bacterium]